jgi:hypothetical protein
MGWRLGNEHFALQTQYCNLDWWNYTQSVDPYIDNPISREGSGSVRAAGSQCEGPQVASAKDRRFPVRRANVNMLWTPSAKLFCSHGSFFASDWPQM